MKNQRLISRKARSLTKKEEKNGTESIIKQIPIQLQKKAFGFVKLKPQSKIPFEKEWQNNPYNYSSINEWVSANNNYGVIGGYGDLIIIDADTEELCRIVKERLPQTFSVKTPKKGEHSYFYCKGLNTKIVLNKGDVHHGEIIAKGSQVVGAGSIHPDTGTEYTIENNVDIAEITIEDLYSALAEYIEIKYPQKDSAIENDALKISDIINKYDIKLEIKGLELCGCHPIHGSTTGQNFFINTEKNVWHCFRCNSGGGAFYLLAVLEGIIDCGEAKIGALDSDKFKKVLKIAEEKLGYISKGNNEQPKENVMELLEKERNTLTIHPSQDFVGVIMFYGVKLSGKTCMINSKKEFFSIEEGIKHGYWFSNMGLDTAKFSASGIRKYIKGGYSVNIADLYQKIYRYIKRFVKLNDEDSIILLTLWTMGTYIFSIFRYYPYIWLNAEKQSGKTLLMEVLSVVAFNGDLSINPTEAVIFRDIANNKITMFIDEVEQLRKRDKEAFSSIISVLNAGFNRNGVVKRNEGMGNGKFKVKSYNVYSPKMFAGINEIDEVLQDRTIKVKLLRKKDNEPVERYKNTAEIETLQQEIRDDLYVFGLTCGRDIAYCYHNDDNIRGIAHLGNRELDIWEPIFVLANIVDDVSRNSENEMELNVTASMERLSKASFEEKQADSITQNDTYKVLSVIKRMFDDESIHYEQENDNRIYRTEDVLVFFKGQEEFEYLEKPNSLTIKLKKADVRSEQRRVSRAGKARFYIIDHTKTLDLFERYKI